MGKKSYLCQILDVEPIIINQLITFIAMRKIFTLLTMCMLASAAWAVDIVFDATVDVGTGSSTAGEFTIVKDGITVHVEQGVANGTHYRFYKGKKVTVTSEIGAMTRIVFDCVGADNEQYGSGGFTSEPGDYAPDGKLGIWANSGAAQVVFTATNFQVRATKITVSVGGDVGLMAPRITPAAGEYHSNVEVSMACSTPGAKIYYTTNGNTPTTGSTLYTAPFSIPFELGTSVVVKAISEKDGEVSSVVSATYEFTEAPSFGWGDMFNTNDNTNVTFTYPSTVLWQSGSTMYCKDETGFGLVYQSTGHTYQIGDIIPAGFGGSKTTYNGKPELQGPKGFQAAAGNVHVDAEVITPSQVDEAHWAHYVLLKGVVAAPSGNGGTFTATDGSSCTYFTNTFGVAAPTDGQPHDVYGIVAAYRDVYQILPIEFDKEPGPEPPTPVVSIDELYELNQGKLGIFTTPLTAIYQNGPYLYVKDVEGTYSLAYGTVAYKEFVNGDYIDNAVASWTVYRKNKQISPAGDTFVKAGHGTPVDIEIMPIEELAADMIYWYVGFEDVKIEAGEAEFTYTITDETGSLKVYDKNFKAMPENLTDGTYYVEGFLSIDNDELELFPILVKAAREYPKGDVNGDYEVNIADVNCLIDVILGSKTAEMFEGRAYVNDDDEVNIADVNAVIAIILGL